MNELHRDPPRWLESGFLSEELTRELAAYGAEAPAAASKARMLEQLTAVEVIAPATMASPALVKLKLFLVGSAMLAGAVGFLQFARPEPMKLPAAEAVRSVETRLAPIAESRLAAEVVPAEVVRDDVAEVEVAELVQRVRAPRVERRVVLREVERQVEAQEAPVQASSARPDVLAELTMLARARRALLNDPMRALELSEEHAQSYPRGTFDEEREVLAIESLVKLGRHDEARARERAFEKRFPRSAQIAHLANLIAKPSE